MDDIKKSLVTNIDADFKEGTTDMVDKKVKQNLIRWSNPSHLLFQKKIRLTQSTKQINHKNPIKQLIRPKSIELKKLNQWINQVLLK